MITKWNSFSRPRWIGVFTAAALVLTFAAYWGLSGEQESSASAPALPRNQLVREEELKDHRPRLAPPERQESSPPRHVLPGHPDAGEDRKPRGPGLPGKVKRKVKTEAA